MLWNERDCVRLLWCQIVDFALRERSMYLRKIEVSEVKRNRMRMHITSLSYVISELDIICQKNPVRQIQMVGWAQTRVGDRSMSNHAEDHGPSWRCDDLLLCRVWCCVLWEASV